MRRQLPWLPPILAIVGLLVLAPQVLLSLLIDGGAALVVLLAATGYGIWTLPLVRRLARFQQLLWVAAVGLGIFGHLCLLLAWAGWLSQTSMLVLTGTGGLALLIGLHRWQESLFKRAAAEAESEDPLADAAVSLLVTASVAILLIAATLAPGTLWLSEARGYDALEYHLQGPREYWQAGRMEFLPHNVYASFPQQVEVLYLALMYLLDDPHAAAIPSQVLHALLTILAMLAVVAFVPGGGPRRSALLIIGTVPWLPVVGSLAYVEGGMLLFAAVAGGLLYTQVTAEHPCRKLLLAAGIAAGLAGGCKYTGLVLVVLGLALTWMLCSHAAVGRRLQAVLLFGLAAALTFAPWAARNAAETGNPVFPLAYGVFGSSQWSADQEAQWARGHTVTAENAGALGRLDLARRELFNQSNGYGLVMLLTLLCAVQAGRSGLLPGVWLITMLITWIAATHIPGRFVVVALAAAAWLIALAVHQAGPQGRRLLLAASFLVAAANLWHTLARLDRNLDSWRRLQVRPLHDLAGGSSVFVEAHPLNQLPPEARLYLVGNAAVFYINRPLHYTVVFSRDPWLTAAEALSPAACVAWLAQAGWTHVVFDWGEIERLRGTYGFPEIVQREWVAALVAEGGLQRVALPGPPTQEVYAVPQPGP